MHYNFIKLWKLLNVNIINFVFTIFVDTTEKKDFESTEKLKLNNFLFIEDKEFTKCMLDKVNFKNAITFYSVAKTNNLFSVAGMSIRLIEMCFPMLIKTENFSQLDFDCVVKIISSSELNIHSEVEIFDSANTWLKHNSEELCDSIVTKYSPYIVIRTWIEIYKKIVIHRSTELMSLKN